MTGLGRCFGRNRVGIERVTAARSVSIDRCNASRAPLRRAAAAALASSSILDPPANQIRIQAILRQDTIKTAKIGAVEGRPYRFQRVDLHSQFHGEAIVRFFCTMEKYQPRTSK